MLFSSNIFLFLFLPLVIVVYYLLRKNFRNTFLLAMSLLFYAWGEPKFVFIMIGSIIFNYVVALLIDKTRSTPQLCKGLLVAAVAGNLGILFVFKYLDFAIENLNRLGLSLPLAKIALPIGISFFTFQAMSYVIDVYRQTVKVQKSLPKLGLYISFFPQLIAGPIVRYQTIEKQLDDRVESFDKFAQGVQRFLMGLGKKVLLSNNMALIADSAFNMPDAQRSVAYAWVGVLAYSLQIFFDFSGYSDMAIGLGKMFGFEFLENFDYPYISKSVSEFWRRWHMSLGQWFRDYVYFPLGGSRVETKTRLVFNLFVVWLLTGVWHGAQWNFILWGLMYFVLLTFEKLTGYPKKFKTKTAQILYRVFTLLAVMFGWVLFRAQGAQKGFQYMLSMFGLAANPAFSVDVVVAFREYWLFILFGILISTPVFKHLKTKLTVNEGSLLCKTTNGATTIFYLFILMWCVSFLILGSYNPFIYFNF